MDLFAAIEAKERGMDQAADSRNELVNRVRNYLEFIARNRADRLATADDCAEFLEQINMSSRDLGNAAGCIFKTQAWEFSGTWTPSKRKTNNARYIRVWRLK
jgi:hypothetical protein